jgi:hypothetical protein
MKESNRDKALENRNKVSDAADKELIDIESVAAAVKAPNTAKNRSVRVKTEKGQPYQFVVELLDFKPRIWRRFQISGAARLQDFCYAVMVMFHCMGGHLHQLIVCNRPTEVIYMPRDDDFDDYGGVRQLMADKKVGDIFENEKDKAILEYDFGDGWAFKITLEKKEPESKLDGETFAKVLTGKGFGIIEDCGGVWGLADIYEALKGGECPDSFDSIEKMEEWLEDVLPCELDRIKNGAFDYFDTDYVNEELEDVENFRVFFDPV